MSTVSASGKPQFRDLSEPNVPGFAKATINDLESVEHLISDRTVAVMTRTGSGGAVECTARQGATFHAGR